MENSEIYLQRLTAVIVKHFTEQKPNFSSEALEIIKEIENGSDDSIRITKKEYEGLNKDSRILLALQGAGVDNWEGFDSAMEMLDEME